MKYEKLKKFAEKKNILESDAKKNIREQLKDKKFTTLSTKEKDLLLETMAKMLGLIDG